MGRTVNRSSGTGRFVSNAARSRWPSKTTTERVGSGTSNSKTVYRSSGTGKFVSKETAKQNPSGTISQRV